jgi:hypothetical protein
MLACGPHAKEAVDVQKNNSLKNEAPPPLVCGILVVHCGTENKQLHYTLFFFLNTSNEKFEVAHDEAELAKSALLDFRFLK